MEAEKEIEEKVTYKKEIKCPHCSKHILIERIKKIITPSIKAEIEEYLKVGKSDQTRLPE